MTDKFLRVTFSDGKTFDIPSHIIVHSRATYYANHDAGECKRGVPAPTEWVKVYNEETIYTLSDNQEITDWAFNNMDWKDVAFDAKEVLSEGKNSNYEKEWTNVKSEIITK